MLCSCLASGTSPLAAIIAAEVSVGRAETSGALKSHGKGSRLQEYLSEISPPYAALYPGSAPAVYDGTLFEMVQGNYVNEYIFCHILLANP